MNATGLGRHREAEIDQRVNNPAEHDRQLAAHAIRQRAAPRREGRLDDVDGGPHQRDILRAADRVAQAQQQERIRGVAKAGSTSRTAHERESDGGGSPNQGSRVLGCSGARVHPFAGSLVRGVHGWVHGVHGVHGVRRRRRPRSRRRASRRPGCRESRSTRTGGGNGRAEKSGTLSRAAGPTMAPV